MDGNIVAYKLCKSQWILWIEQYIIGGQQQQHAHLKSHYRGHHIAVWLQLIPQLHQPGSGNGEAVSSHHQFDQDTTPVDQFYEGNRPSILPNSTVYRSMVFLILYTKNDLYNTGVVRLVSNSSNAFSRAASTLSSSSGVAPTAASVECVSSYQRNLNGHNQTLNGTSSGIGKKGKNFGRVPWQRWNI